MLVVSDTREHELSFQSATAVGVVARVVSPVGSRFDNPRGRIGGLVLSLNPIL